MSITVKAESSKVGQIPNRIIERALVRKLNSNIDAVFFRPQLGIQAAKIPSNGNPPSAGVRPERPPLGIED